MKKIYSWEDSDGVVLTLIIRIEDCGVSIGSNWWEWEQIAFSLSSFYGDTVRGRDFFQRTMNYYQEGNFSEEEVDRIYTKCFEKVKLGKVNNFSIATFIFFAKKALDKHFNPNRDDNS